MFRNRRNRLISLKRGCILAFCLFCHNGFNLRILLIVTGITIIAILVLLFFLRENRNIGLIFLSVLQGFWENTFAKPYFSTWENYIVRRDAKTQSPLSLRLGVSA